MSEGGLLPWKIQEIKELNRPLVQYDKLSIPLPDPPQGMIWMRDHDTHEWSLVRRDGNSDSVSLHQSIESGICQDHDRDGNEIAHVVEHIVLPTDTFMGICLSYKIAATKLRQINRFSGTNLSLAPSKLLIPVRRRDVGQIKRQGRESTEFKLYCLLAEVSHLPKRAAEAYLTIAEQDLHKAIHEARSDLEWEESNMLTLPDRIRSHQDSVDAVDKVPRQTAAVSTLCQNRFQE